jgi:glycosyltransferase involved in cell wall biosynthesis
VGTAVKWLRNWSLKTAGCNVVLGEIMADRLRGYGVSGESIRIIHNWSDDEQIYPVPREDNPLRVEWGVTGKFVVGYSGNIGRAHEFDTILDAAEKMLDDDRVVFLFIGGGAMEPYIKQQANIRKLTNIRLMPYQSRSQLVHSLNVPDIHLISLRPELEGLIVPSKFYGIAAAGKASIFVGSKDGELARVLRINECGSCVEDGDVQGLVDIIQYHVEHADALERMGRNARELYLRRFTARQAMLLWADVLIQGENA